MKKILYTAGVALSAVVLMTSCKQNNAPIATEGATLPVSATEYAAFKEWKQQQQQQEENIQHTRYYAPQHKTVVYRTKTVVVPAQPAKKKGWSKAAKGTVIGAGTGAAAGALLVKNNRALGAVVGGIVGGGIGYGVGHSMDKKDGRY